MDQELRVRALGGAELTLDGRSLVERIPAKAAAMVFHLALAGRARSRSELAGLLWSDLPEATARANLRLTLTKLRKVLPDHLDATRHHVGLTTDPPVRVDVEEVLAVPADAPPDEVLAAVRMCGGDLLAGFAVAGAPLFEEWLSARRAAVRTEVLALMDRAVRHARDRRDAAAGIEVTRRMVGMEPLHEEAHRDLMWFLALDERRSAAVAQFETCRYLLREELGTDPEPATVALRDAIVGRGASVRPVPLTVSGGSNDGKSDEESGRDVERDARRAVPRRPGPEPPHPLTELVGRERELARLAELLRDPACRLVTLVGPGGIGKTRLATEVATVHRAEHPDGAVFVSFVGVEAARSTDAEGLFVAGLARALGVSLAVPRDPLELVAEHLAGRRLLLVLDNLEHVRDGAGAVAELLARLPGLMVVATSRRPLGLGAEWLVEVRGLACPPPGAGRDADRYAAVQLFHQRALLLRPGYRSDDGDEGAARVCRLVEGVPLAIELAARWVRSAAPGAIADRLADGDPLLETTAADVEERHRSLRSVIDWSYALLTDAERTALGRLSVLRGGFDLDAAGAVAGADLPLLAALVEQSLVSVGEDGRYAMHELLRQYAAARLAEDPAQEGLTRRRHAELFAARLRARSARSVSDSASPSASPDRGSSPADGGPVARDTEDVRAATEWLVAEGTADELDAHLVHLWSVYRSAGWFREAQTFFAAALERDDATTLHRARWHRMLGEAHQQVGEAQPARHHLEQALRLLGHRVPDTTAGWMLAVAGQAARSPLSGRRRFRRPARREDLRAAAHERAMAAHDVNEVYWVLEDHLPILATSLRTLADARLTGDLDVVSQAHAGVGMALGTLGLHGPARRHLRASDLAGQECRDPVTSCWLAILGGLHRAGVGEWAAVEAGAARARELQLTTATHRLGDQVLLVAAVARYLASRYPEAAEAAHRGMVAGRRRRDPVVQFWGLVILVETTLRADPGDPALDEWTAEATQLLPRVARIDAARLHAATARRHLAAGRPADAWDAVLAADRLVGPRPPFEQYALEAVAGVPEVCLALLEDGSVAAGSRGPDREDLRAAVRDGGRRLAGYARTFPVARPRALVVTGRAAWLDGRHRAARTAWARAVAQAQALRMPYELGRAHEELGTHLDPRRRSPLRLDRAEHLNRALAAFREAGCPADVDRVRSLMSGHAETARPPESRVPGWRRGDSNP